MFKIKESRINFFVQFDESFKKWQWPGVTSDMMEVLF